MPSRTLVFAARGIAPVGYAAFAFSLGVTAGGLIRRTLPAMATTAAVVAGVQIAMANWIRPHLIEPLRAIPPPDVSHLQFVSLQPNNHISVMAQVTRPGAWVLSNLIITPSGHVFTGPATEACLTGSPRQCNAWLAGQPLRQLLTYQPASRFWALQWYETGILVAAAIALAWFCAWWIRRRRLA